MEYTLQTSSQVSSILVYSCRCLRVELMGQLVIMFCLTLILLNVMHVLAGQYDIVGEEEDKEAACVTVTGLLHVFALSGQCERQWALFIGQWKGIGNALSEAEESLLAGEYAIMEKEVKEAATVTFIELLHLHGRQLDHTR